MHDAEALRDVVFGLWGACVRPLAVLRIHLPADSVEVETPRVSGFWGQVRSRVDERGEGNGEFGDKAAVLIVFVVEGTVDLSGG